MKNKEYKKVYEEYLRARDRFWNIRDQEVRKQASQRILRILYSIRKSLEKL